MSGVDNRRPEVAALVPSARRVLDVACAWGGFGALLAERGGEVWGVEPDAERARSAEQRLTRVIVGRYPDAMPAGERFDCIVFNDVLEHMADPERALAAAAAQLEVGGSVIASIPNVRHVSVTIPLLLRGRWDYAEWGVLDRTHVRFLTKASMRELFEAAGFVVHRQEPVNVTEAVGKLAPLRLLGRRREGFCATQFVIVAGRSGQ